MGKIFITSDLHFFHNQSFIYEPRGFDNVYDMNNAIVKNWNNKLRSTLNFWNNCEHIYSCNYEYNK